MQQGHTRVEKAIEEVLVDLGTVEESRSLGAKLLRWSIASEILEYMQSGRSG